MAENSAYIMAWIDPFAVHATGYVLLLLIAVALAFELWRAVRDR